MSSQQLSETERRSKKKQWDEVKLGSTDTILQLLTTSALTLCQMDFHSLYIEVKPWNHLPTMWKDDAKSF